MLVIGVDEAGRGPVIGPLVVCSVAIPSKDEKLLLDMGVKDSKYLSAKKRQNIHSWFMENYQTMGWNYSITYGKPEQIDEAVYRNGLNLLECQLFAESINRLNIQNKLPTSIICDACDVDEVRFTRRVAQSIESWPWNNSQINSYHKADDQFLVVGLASILAKQARDKAIQYIQETLDFPIGSGYPSDAITIAAVHSMIDPVPHEQLRWSWSTVERIWKENHSTNVPIRTITNGQQKTLF